MYGKFYLFVRCTKPQVALKLIDKKKLTSPKVRQKVDREISNMEKLRHGNIVEIFESTSQRN